jgi:hypothetical protein
VEGTPDPGVLADGRDRRVDGLGLSDGDRVADLVGAQPVDELGRPEAGVHPKRQLAGRVRAAQPGDQFVDEPQDPAGGVRRALAQPCVQHLAAVGGKRQQRVQAELAGGAVASALLVIAADLADRGVHVHHQRPVPRARTRRPCPGQQLAGDPVELADVAEGERAQPGPDRGRRHHAVTQHALGRPGAQQLGVVDAVTAGEHGVDQGEQLASRTGRARPVTQIDQLVGDLLDPQPLGQGRGQQQPGVGDRPGVVEGDLDLVQDDG